MSKCENCGAEIVSKFCPYCGTKTNFEEEKKVEKSNSKTTVKTSSQDDVMDVFGMSSKFNDLLRMTSTMEEEGRTFLNDDEMSILNDIKSYSLNLSARSDELSAQIKSEKQRLRNARRAIASGHCPECNAVIKKNTEYCPKCGADCLIESYGDL